MRHAGQRSVHVAGYAYRLEDDEQFVDSHRPRVNGAPPSRPGGVLAYEPAARAVALDSGGDLPDGRRELVRLELVHAGHRLGEAVDHYPLVLSLAREADREGHAGKPTPIDHGLMVSVVVRTR